MGHTTRHRYLPVLSEWIHQPFQIRFILLRQLLDGRAELTGKSLFYFYGHAVAKGTRQPFGHAAPDVGNSKAGKDQADRSQ